MCQLIVIGEVGGLIDGFATLQRCGITMSKRYEVNMNKPGKFPLQSVGEYFEKIGKLAHAKQAYKRAMTSPLASEIDVANAKHSIQTLDKRLRETDEALVDVTTSVMLPTKDLSTHPEAKMDMGTLDYHRLKDDIAERGIKIPLAVDMQNRVVCGAHRLKAAKELKIEEVPCFIVGFTDVTDIKRYAIADNLARRQLSVKERKAWAVELLRLRKEIADSIRGRKKSGPKKEGDVMSNRDIAKATGLDSATVDRAEKSLPQSGKLGSKSAKSLKVAKKTLVQCEKFGDTIVKGKSKNRDLSFPMEAGRKLQDRITHVLDSMNDGERFQYHVEFEIEEKSE